MTSASQLIWRSAGCPTGSRSDMIENIEGVCALCGHSDTKTVPLMKACPPASFGGWQQMRWPSSDRVCRACSWSMEGMPPNTLRMWSILYRDDGVKSDVGPSLGENAAGSNRANLIPILETLCCPPECTWAVGVAESGKVHVVPYMHTNKGDGLWAIRVDRITLRESPTKMRHDVFHFSSLLAAGFRAKAIVERNPPIKDLSKIGIDVWKKHIEALGPASAGQTERLVAMMIKKEVANEWAERTSDDA
jgi:hypothetical protein